MVDKKEVEQSFFAAIHANDVDRVDELVTLYGLSYCESWAGGYALLCKATEFGHDELAQFLVQKGAKVACKNCTVVDTPLHHAVRKGSPELVEMLMNKSHVADAQNQEDCLRFYYGVFRIAAIRGNVDVLQLVFNRDARSLTLLDALYFIARYEGFAQFADFRVFWGCNLHLALVLASSQGDEEVVSALLSVGVGLNPAAESRVIIEQFQILGQWNHFMDYDLNSLNNFNELHEFNDYFHSPLFLACARGHLGVVKLFYQHGAEFNRSRRRDTYQPIHLASEGGHVEIVDFLLGLGVSPSAETVFHETPLHSVAKRDPSKPRKSLCLMVKPGSSRPSEVIELLLVKGANINARTRYRSTPLLVAVEHGNAVVAEILLERGADINATDTGNKSPLQVAVNGKNSSLVNLLLRHNPAIDDKIRKSVLNIVIDCDGYIGLVDNFFEYDHIFSREHVNDPKLLWDAVEKGYSKMVRTFLHYGLDRGDQIYDPTLLHAAVKNGQTEVIDLLLKSGYDINFTDEVGNAPIYYVMSCQDREKWIEIFRILLVNGAVISDASKFLHRAIDMDCLEICKILIENFGADVRAPNELGQTPLLSILFQTGNPHSSWESEKRIETVRAEIAELLLNSGANMPTLKCSDVVELLVDNHASMNVQASSSSKPLVPTLKRGHEEVIKLLLERGAVVKINEDDNDYDATLLHTAVKFGQLEIIKLLLHSGYDVNAPDGNGITPICHTMECSDKSKWPEIFRILLASGAVINDASKFLHEAIDRECCGICEILIENCGADMNALNTQGKTPLQSIVSKVGYSESNYQIDDAGNSRPEQRIREGEKQVKIARAEIARLLLRKGADVHFESAGGFTALHIAILSGNIEAIGILLNSGADVNSRAKKNYFVENGRTVQRFVVDGPSPLHLAVKRWCAGLNSLVDFDVDVNIRENFNQTALHHAVIEGSKGDAEILLENGCDMNVENHEGKTALDLALAKAVDRNMDKDPLCDALKQHAIKLITAGLHISEKIRKQVDPDSVPTTFKRNCEKELNKLKGENYRHLTLYDILMDLRNPAYLKDEHLRETLGSLNFDSYPIYGKLIANSIKKNKRRIELLISGKKSFNILVKTSSVLNETPVLLDEVVEEILLYLSNNELKNLISAGDSLKTQLLK